MERLVQHYDVGVIVGRFQVNELHPGHVELLDWVTQQHKKVIVALGISPAKGSRNDPLDFEARSMLLREKYPNLIIFGIQDSRSDDHWSMDLDNGIRPLLTPGQTAVLYGSRSSFIRHYNGKFPTQELVGDGEFWTGTEVRDRIRQQVLPGPEFRAGVIWAALNSYPRVFPTVDIAIVKTVTDDQNNITGHLVLMVKRSPKVDPIDKWRFIGGFSDPNTSPFEDDAIREIYEETGMEVGRPLIYLGSAAIEDWRYRGSKDQIKTLLFKAHYVFGALPKLQDDLEGGDAQWLDPLKITTTDIVPEHIPLLKLLCDDLSEKGNVSAQ